MLKLCVSACEVLALYPHMRAQARPHLASEAWCGRSTMYNVRFVGRGLVCGRLHSRGQRCCVLAVSGVVGVLVPRVQARPQRLNRKDLGRFFSSMWSM